MSNILLLSPAAIASAGAGRGSGTANLLTFDPKEVWRDSAAGTEVHLTFDLGAARPIDTICLAAVYGAAADARWRLSGGLATYGEFAMLASSPLRSLDAAGQQPYVSHAFWHGAAVVARFVTASLTQPAGSAPLAVGRMLAGKAFVPTWNQEWGAGRGVIDTATVTPLPSGGFAVVEGVRKGVYAFTLGDLTDEEVEALYALQLEHGESRPMLVVENTDATPGLRNRIHYCLFRSLRKFARRNPAQTSWELSIEEWV